MAPGDVPLFASFILSDEANMWQRWDFDVSVGPGIDPGPGFDPEIRSNAIYLTQAKIDVVGWAGNIPTIFEVKPQLSIQGFGQLIAYRWYFQQHTGIYAHLAGITDYMNDMYRILYDAFDIDIYIVPHANPYKISLAVQKVKEMNGGEIKPVRLVWTGVRT
jgi:hypothetical protein